MKKYLIYISISLVIILASLLGFEIYKNKQLENPATQSQIEELQKRIGELEKNKVEQFKVVETLSSEVGQLKETQAKVSTQAKDEQMSKLEKDINTLKISIKNNNFNQFESRVALMEKFLFNRFGLDENFFK